MQRRSGGMAYTYDSKSYGLTALWVQVPPSAPIKNSTIFSVDTNGRRKAPTKVFWGDWKEN